MVTCMDSNSPIRQRNWEPLRDVLAEAERTQTAAGYFNATELVGLKGIASAALELQLPVIVGASEKERVFSGVRQIAALVLSIREEHDFPIFLNADHTHSLRTAVEAARAGFDAVGYPGPAVRNMHGLTPEIIAGRKKKRLNIERIRAIRSATDSYLTLHGGSGTNDRDFQCAIKAGITVIHINTEIRIALKDGLAEGLARHKGDVIPYVILQSAVEAVRQVVRARLRLFNSSAAAAAE